MPFHCYFRRRCRYRAVAAIMLLFIWGFTPTSSPSLSLRHYHAILRLRSFGLLLVAIVCITVSSHGWQFEFPSCHLFHCYRHCITPHGCYTLIIILSRHYAYQFSHTYIYDNNNKKTFGHFNISCCYYYILYTAHTPYIYTVYIMATFYSHYFNGCARFVVLPLLHEPYARHYRYAICLLLS